MDYAVKQSIVDERVALVILLVEHRYTGLCAQGLLGVLVGGGIAQAPARTANS